MIPAAADSSSSARAVPRVNRRNVQPARLGPVQSTTLRRTRDFISRVPDPKQELTGPNNPAFLNRSIGQVSTPNQSAHGCIREGLRVRDTGTTRPSRLGWESMGGRREREIHNFCAGLARLHARFVDLNPTAGTPILRRHSQRYSRTCRHWPRGIAPGRDARGRSLNDKPPQCRRCVHTNDTADLMLKARSQ